MVGISRLLMAMAAQLALSGAAPPALDYYRCEAGVTLPQGAVHIMRLVDAQGATIEFRAESRNNDGPHLHYDIFWSGEAMDQGKFIVRTGGFDTGRRPVRTIFLECGPNFESCTAGYRYETELHANAGIGAANLPVVLALARTWGKLYVLVEDDRGKLLFHHPIDVAGLYEVEATARRLAGLTAEMARDPKDDCEYEPPWEPIPTVRQRPLVEGAPER